MAEYEPIDDPARDPTMAVLSSPPKIGPVTWETYWDRARAVVKAKNATVPLDGRNREDAEALRAWAAFIKSIGGGQSALYSSILYALDAPAERLARWGMPTRWPSEMTGDPSDDLGQL